MFYLNMIKYFSIMICITHITNTSTHNFDPHTKTTLIIHSLVATVSAQHSDFYQRAQWLDAGIEVLISKIPNLTINDANLKRKEYFKQAINDHHFATRVRKMGWLACKPDEDEKVIAQAALIALQEHATVRKLIMSAAEAEQQALTVQLTKMTGAIKTAQILRDAQAALEARNKQDLENPDTLARSGSVFRIPHRKSNEQ